MQEICKTCLDKIQAKHLHRDKQRHSHPFVPKSLWKKQKKNSVLKLSQETFTLEVLRRFNMADCKPLPTPAVDTGNEATMAEADCPSTPDEQKAIADLPFLELIGRESIVIGNKNRFVCWLKKIKKKSYVFVQGKPNSKTKQKQTKQKLK